ncbi:hypothetical protein HN51_045904 [Arachis hypogaea]
MEQLGVRHRMMFTGQHEDEGYESQSSLDTCEDELLNDEEEEEIINNKILPEIKKRKRLSLSELREVKESCQRQSISKLKTHNYESKNRWSSQRYKVAEQRMWEILKAEGATFEHPITRPALRMAARKHISDTGLLDHLLKHIDGKVAPGGIERFRSVGASIPTESWSIGWRVLTWTRSTKRNSCSFLTGCHHPYLWKAVPPLRLLIHLMN